MSESPVTFTPITACTGLFSKKNYFHESSIVSDRVVSSKTSENNVCADAISTKGNNLIQEDMKASQGIKTIGAQDEAKDTTASSMVRTYTPCYVGDTDDGSIKYHLANLKDETKDTTGGSTTHDHCVLKLIAYFLIKKKDPIVAGVQVIEGTAKIGTPLCIPCRDHIYIGRITSMKDHHTPLTSAGKGEEALIMIESGDDVDQPKMFRRNAQLEELLVCCSDRAN